MRSIQVIMLTLCIVGGLYLLIQAPVFFMPSRWNPHVGHLFGTTSSRLLGAGLLTIAWAGWNYFQHFYYRERRLLSSESAQLRYFVSILIALGLISSAFLNAQPVLPTPALPAKPAPTTDTSATVPAQHMSVASFTL